MVTTIGWINIVFIVVMGSIYPIKQTYLKKMKEEGKEKAEPLGKLYRFSRKAHPALGVIILILGFYHGYQAFSLTVLHTGTVLLYLILAMGIVAIAGQKVKAFRKHWRTVHRTMGGFVFLFAVIHVFWRNLF